MHVYSGGRLRTPHMQKSKFIQMTYFFIIQLESKRETPYLTLIYIFILHQILTDFQNAFVTNSVSSIATEI